MIDPFDGARASLQSRRKDRLIRAYGRRLERKAWPAGSPGGATNRRLLNDVRILTFASFPNDAIPFQRGTDLAISRISLKRLLIRYPYHRLCVPVIRRLTPASDRACQGVRTSGDRYEKFRFPFSRGSVGATAIEYGLIAARHRRRIIGDGAVRSATRLSKTFSSVASAGLSAIGRESRRRPPSWRPFRS